MMKIHPPNKERIQIRCFKQNHLNKGMLFLLLLLSSCTLIKFLRPAQKAAKVIRDERVVWKLALTGRLQQTC